MATWLHGVYSYPAMEIYRKLATPAELHVSKGLGRILVCESLRAFVEHAPSIWPDIFPNNNSHNLKTVGLYAISSMKGGPRTRLNKAQRMLFGLGVPIGKQASLVDYYQQLGFTTAKRRISGATYMTGNIHNIIATCARS